jgi:hypothetical protein
VFDVYDTNDQDWILVGHGSDFGFVPSNYIEYIQQQQQQPQQPQQQQQPIQPVEPAQPPAQQQYQVPAAPPASLNKPLPSHPTTQTDYSTAQYTNGSRGQYEEEEERPPPMPTRPGQRGAGRQPEPEPSSSESADKPSQFYSWSIQEVDGRKKYRATLAIGNGNIMYSPEKANGAPQQWDVNDLISYDHEKKHVFLEFQHPGASLDLHAGSKDTAEEIVSALGEIAGANKAMGLREVYMAANSAGQQIGKVLYDFQAQGDDEVTVREGDNVFVLDSKKSNEWWMVKAPNGEEGVMPSSYVELATAPGKKVPDQPLVGSSSRVRSNSGASRSRGLSDPRKKDRKSEIMPPSKSKPDMNKVRTWTDRSGSFKVDAALLGCAEGKIHLHKLNGVKIAVAASKMSVEDLEYVEKVTGVPLDDDKPLVDVKRSSTRGKRERQSVQLPGGPSTGGGNNRPSPAGSTSSVHGHSASQQITSQPAKPEYDWFGFFLDCGVDINNCQRYALNFNRDQMDESILEDISPEVLRNLGLKEGDILRVTKKLDERFNRRKQEENGGGLFSGSGGTLKNNTSKPAPNNNNTNNDNNNKQSATAPSGNSSSNSFEDDAWAIKQQSKSSPAPQQQQQSSTPQQPQQPEPTGSMRDLLGMTPLEPVKTAAAQQAPKTQSQPQPQAQTVAAPAAIVQQPILQPTLSGQQQQIVQPTYTGQQAIAPLQPSYTGGGTMVNPQYVGIPVQQTTGGLVQQRTGGGTPMPMNTTGGLVQQRTGGGTPMPMGQQLTGGGVQQPLGPFATGNSQPLGPFATGQAQQLTGGFSSTPASPFLPQQTTYSQPQANMSAPTLNNLANQFQQTSISNSNNMFNQGMQQPSMGFQQPQPQSPFATPFQQPQQPQMQPQQTQPLQGQPTGFGFGNQPGSSFPGAAAQTLGMNQQQPMQQQQPQQQYAPLTPQKTGPHPPVSFGGPQPLQNTPTGRRANLAAATPNNPFGF